MTVLFGASPGLAGSREVRSLSPSTDQRSVSAVPPPPGAAVGAAVDAAGAVGAAAVGLPLGAGVAGVAAGFPQAARTSANSSRTTPANQSLCVRIGNTFL